MGPPHLPSGDPAVGRLRGPSIAEAHKNGRIPWAESSRSGKEKSRRSVSWSVGRSYRPSRDSESTHSTALARRPVVWRLGFIVVFQNELEYRLEWAIP